MAIFYTYVVSNNEFQNHYKYVCNLKKEKQYSIVYFQNALCAHLDLSYVQHFEHVLCKTVGMFNCGYVLCADFGIWPCAT